MKVQNKSRRTYQHSYFNEKGALVIIELLPGSVKEVDDKIAETWLKTGDVIEYADPKEQAKLADENAKLKEELAKLKGESTETKDIDELKKEADELGITYAKNIGAAKLQEKINKFKEA